LFQFEDIEDAERFVEWQTLCLEQIFTDMVKEAGEGAVKVAESKCFK